MVKKKVSKKVPVVNAPKAMSPEEVIKHCKANIVDVLIPSWNATVRCKLPNAQAIYDMRLEAKDDEGFQRLLFKASLMDFSDKQIKKLESEDGLKFFALYNSVINCTDLFRQKLSVENIKN